MALLVSGGCGIIAAIPNAIESKCFTDADCQDGVFCNGEEKCVETCRNTISLGLYGLGFCGTPGPNVCKPATGRELIPCCTWGSPHSDACESACNVVNDACDIGNECITDSDCDDGIECTGLDHCDVGFCYSHKFAGGSATTLDECLDACQDAGFDAVGQYFGPGDCNCALAEEKLCSGDEKFSIKADEGVDCNSICGRAGWPFSLTGSEPQRSCENCFEVCSCSKVEVAPTTDVASCADYCSSEGFDAIQRFRAGVDGTCQCTLSSSFGILYHQESSSCEHLCVIAGWSIGRERKSNTGDVIGCDCDGPVRISNESEPTAITISLLSVTSSGNLMTIDNNSGQQTLFGSNSETFIPRSMDGDPISRLLYGVDLFDTSGPSDIYQIDSTTGVSTRIASVTKDGNTFQMLALAFSPDGTLYATKSHFLGFEIGRVDLTTESFETVMEVKTEELTMIYSMDFSPSGTLYAILVKQFPDFSQIQTLVSIDLVNKAIDQVGIVEPYTIGDIDFASDGSIYTTNFSFSIIQINPINAVSTSVGFGDLSALNGIASFPSIEAEPFIP